MGPAPLAPTHYLSYEQAFIDALGINPLSDDDASLLARARRAGFDEALLLRCDRNELLDLLIGTCVGPQLGKEGPVFIHRYPASQAALARLDPDDARVALRFELYLRGVELANGFEELADGSEQRARFTADQRSRAARNLSVPAMDDYLLAALDAGLLPCSGVALGFDRLLMLACNAERIDEVMAFTSERA
jgi:lysyl-tRNA synthetase class 2